MNGFYEKELNYRKQLGYPPYARLARLEYRHADPGKAEEESQKTASRLKVKIEAERRHQTELIGPVPSFLQKKMESIAGRSSCADLTPFRYYVM